MISGDIYKLQQYLERVRDDSIFDEKDANDIGERLHELIMNGFDRSEDPYGRQWAGISHREGKPLLDTLKLVSSIDWQPKKTPEGMTLSVGTDVDYGRYHNIGAGHVRQRMFIPTDSNKLPSSYNNVIMDVITRKLDDAIQQL